MQVQLKKAIPILPPAVRIMPESIQSAEQSSLRKDKRRSDCSAFCFNPKMGHRHPKHIQNQF